MKKACLHVLVLLASFAVSPAAFAQRPAVPVAPTQPPLPPIKGSIAGHPGWPAAKSEDVHSVDAIIAALYDVISGAKGQARDWDRFRSLFLPDGRLIPSRQDRDTHRADALILTVDGYVERASHNMAADGFYERSVHNEVQQFGSIVHVWSTYESRHAVDDEKPFARGINSIQLLKSGDRYRVVQILWDNETPANPIPAQYLPK